SRNFPLRESMKALSTGLPGRMKWSSRRGDLPRRQGRRTIPITTVSGYNSQAQFTFEPSIAGGRAIFRSGARDRTFRTAPSLHQSELLPEVQRSAKSVDRAVGRHEGALAACAGHGVRLAAEHQDRLERLVAGNHRITPVLAGHVDGDPPRLRPAFV